MFVLIVTAVTLRLAESDRPGLSAKPLHLHTQSRPSLIDGAASRPVLLNGNPVLDIRWHFVK
jgi:hypothetical protein